MHYKTKGDQIYPQGMCEPYFNLVSQVILSVAVNFKECVWQISKMTPLGTC